MHSDGGTIVKGAIKWSVGYSLQVESRTKNKLVLFLWIWQKKIFCSNEDEDNKFLFEQKLGCGNLIEI